MGSFRFYSACLLVLYIFFSSCTPESNDEVLIKVPKLITHELTALDAPFANCGGTVLDDGGSEILEQGICWSTSPDPTINDFKTIENLEGKSFASSMTNLKLNISYYVRAYARNKENIGYGDTKAFTAIMIGSIAIVSEAITNINTRNAKASAILTNTSTKTIAEKGYCWGLSSLPTISDNKLISSSPLTNFSDSIKNLSANTSYFLRAFVKVGDSIYYGNELSFTTRDGKASLTTSIANTIKHKSAKAGGKITENGGSEITSRGVCWSTSNNPTISDSKSIDGIGIGSFASSISGLNPNTTYYVRAYAINDDMVTYGNEVTLVTETGKPTINTNAASNTSISNATINSSIAADGGNTITSRGVCWGTSSDPTINNLKTTDGQDIGNYYSELSGLSPNTTYYVRAYAINEDSVTYGNEIVFNTLSGITTINAISATNIEISSATINSTIPSDGGSNITSKGVCWSSSPNPTLANSKTTDGVGLGNYTSNLSNLTNNTNYYARAYAINTLDVTTYSNEITFKTLSGIPRINTLNVTNIDLNTATINSAITSDGGSSIITKGVCWSTNPSPTTLDFKTIDGSGSGNYSSNLSSLTQSTTYYVRAYATNSLGLTSYGNELSFTSSTLLTLQPGSEGKDAYISSLYPTANMGTHPDFNCMAWTSGGNSVIVRSMLEFDLSSIPEGTSLKSAKLSLYNNPTSNNNSGKHSEASVYPSTGGDNGGYLRRITSTWDESIVNWNTQPSTTAASQVSLQASSDAHQDYTEIDVTSLFQDIINNKSNSFGIMLMLKTEIYYRGLVFASSDNLDTTKNPKLIIKY